MTLLACLSITACSQYDDDFIIDHGNQKGNPGARITMSDKRNVLLLYSAGYNSLRSYLLEDIEELKEGWLPGTKRTDDVVLVYTHTSSKDRDYKTETTPYLIRLSCNDAGEVTADTLVTYPAGTISSSAPQLNQVLTYVKNTFPAKGYGMVFSSHATGYLPSGFYTNPNSYQFDNTLMRAGSFRRVQSPIPYVEPEYDPSTPLTKSIGQDQNGAYGSYVSYEMDLQDFAAAIPMKLDYIIFDACLMGGIEVAYELSDVCSKVSFSQAEVLAEGINYRSLTTHLLKNKEPDLTSICEDYFTQYDTQSGVYRSATISLIDCEKLEPLAEVCRDIFNRHREELKVIKPSYVQRFYRSSYHWFYDLESIVLNAGADNSELADLREALEDCVIYKAHTPEFMCEFSINTFSGFSMYLPCNGNNELNKFYKTLLWNEATGLVE